MRRAAGGLPLVGIDDLSGAVPEGVRAGLQRTDVLILSVSLSLSVRPFLSAHNNSSRATLLVVFIAPLDNTTRALGWRRLELVMGSQRSGRRHRDCRCASIINQCDT